MSFRGRQALAVGALAVWDFGARPTGKPGNEGMIGSSLARKTTMQLAGSCHCGAVKFSLDSHTPYPYMRCYCSICRKTAGGGGYAINIMGDAATLKVRGLENVSIYRARIKEPGAKRQ